MNHIFSGITTLSRAGNFCKHILCLHSEKKSTLKKKKKKKKILMGANSFMLETALFQKGFGEYKDKQKVTTAVVSSQKWRKIHHLVLLVNKLGPVV